RQKSAFSIIRQRRRADRRVGCSRLLNGNISPFSAVDLSVLGSEDGMRRALSIVGGLALGFGFAQFPQYAQQYEQRLGGAVDELRIIVDDFDRGAASFGLTREQALLRY